MDSVDILGMEIPHTDNSGIEVPVSTPEAVYGSMADGMGEQVEESKVEHGRFIV